MRSAEEVSGRFTVLCVTVQIWFQNRRMKDKRQRLAMAWPCDPAVYAYLVNAAATSSYPYLAPPAPHPAVFPPPASAPFGYFSAGLQRVAAAAAASSPAYHGVDAVYATPLLRSVDRQRHVPAARSPTTSSESARSPGDQKPRGRLTSASSSSKTESLFQPFKSNIERA